MNPITRAALEDGDSAVASLALRNSIEALALSARGEEAETLWHLKDALGGDCKVDPVIRVDSLNTSG